MKPEEYIRLTVDGYTFQVKIENEGLVLDVFKETEAEPVATTWRFYDDVGLIKIDDRS